MKMNRIYAKMEDLRSALDDAQYRVLIDRERCKNPLKKYDLDGQVLALESCLDKIRKAMEIISEYCEESR